MRSFYEQFAINEICPTTTFKKLSEGILLVDVREKDEVAKLAFNVENLINIPMSEFEEKYQSIPKDKDIVTVCAVGQRSLLAAGFLLKHGYEHSKVTNMKLGLVRWVEKGFPTIGDTSDMSKSTKTCCG
jgi:rhodanese-related sulfurtransferase